MSKQGTQYRCDKCGATFVDPDMLEKHKKVHTTANAAAAKGGGEQPPQGQPRTPPSATAPEPTPPARA